MSPSLSLATQVRERARAIESTRVSVTKWNPIGDLIAEAVGLDNDHVYVTTVSKPGNLGVRLEQSRKAREADVVVVMYTGSRAELERCVESAAKRCHDRRMLLVFADDDAGDKTLVAIAKPKDQDVDEEISAAYPSAVVVDC